MITRKEFLKQCVSSACAAGMCCAISTRDSKAETRPPEACDPEPLKSEKTRADAARARFAMLIRELEHSLPEKDRKQMLHALGGKCAETFKPNLIDHYRGNLKGFLEEGLRLWMAEAHYDESAGTIRIVDKSPTCTCPMVKEDLTPSSFCDCTLGWQEEAYSAILGKPVVAELAESILRGDKRCVYVIKVLEEPRLAS